MVGSPLQKQNGIDDTPDFAFKDWIAWGGPSADEVWARYYIEHSLHDLYFWAESLGATWSDLKSQEGNSVLRWTRTDRNGLGLMTHLIEGFRQKGGEIVTDTEITALTRENGRVTGFEGRNTKTGEPVSVRSKTVVMTTGGFNSSLDMVLEFNPTLGNDQILEGSGRNSTGSGHKMVRQAGGYLTHMDHIWFYVYATPDYRDPAQRRGLVFRLVPGNIWVNQQGRRFHNEDRSGGNSASPALMAQSPAPRLGHHGYADDRHHGDRRSVLPRRRQGRARQGGRAAQHLAIHSQGRHARGAGEENGRGSGGVPRHGRALQQGVRARLRQGAGIRQAAESRRRRSIRRPILPCRSFRWRARISAA